ncbi:MAG: hypothetical protein MJ227_01275 [Bacilli bacterium]|nr:hypothetical protein [Bacilli bacterium]
MKHKLQSVLVVTSLLSLTLLTIPMQKIFTSAHSTYIPEFTVYGYTQNVIDGFVDDVDVYLDGEVVASSDSNGLFKFKATNSDSFKEVSFVKDGYEITNIVLPSLCDNCDLDTVSIDYPYCFFGKTKYKSSLIYNNWSGYSTRGVNSINFKFSSPYNNFVDSASQINLFVDTGDVTSNFSKGDYEFKIDGKSNLFVYDFGKEEAETDLDIFDLRLEVVDGKTDVYLSVPYSYLNINSDAIIGVNFVDNLVSKNIIADFVFDGEIITSSDTANYVRINKYSTPFCAPNNSYDPLWISKQLKAELIEDKPIAFAIKDKSTNSNADNIYAKVIYKEDSIVFNMIGFGYFESDEYIKCVIHSSPNVFYGWGLDRSDIIILFDKENVRLYNNCSDYFATENTATSPYHTEKLTYHDYINYFTIDVELDLSLFTNILNNKQGFRYAFAEFGDVNNNKTIYAPTNVLEYMFVNNTASGDIAGMNSYIAMKSDLDVITIDKEDKKALTKDLKISFGDPNDTFIEENDDMYLDFKRTNNGIDINIIGFGTFQIYETIKAVLHTNSNNGTGWAIQKEDTSIMFNREKCVIKTNINDFWQLNLINSPGTKESTNKPIFIQYDNYFTLSVSLNYEELKNVSPSSTLSVLFLEMDFIGNVYNGGTYLNEMRHNGNPCGDPAMQASYIPIDICK